MTQRISITPNPPVAGQEATVSYSFEGSGVSSTELHVTYTGTDHSDSLVLTVATNSMVLEIPEGATAMLIADLEGPSPTFETFVGSVGEMGA